MKHLKNILVVMLTVMVAVACQNPFSRPVPDALDLSFELVFGSSAARSLSAPADFAGKRLTVQLQAADSSGQPSTVLSSFTTILQEPSATTTSITVPVTFNAVPTRRDLIITGSLADTDPATTIYYTATSPVFQASWTSADEIILPFGKTSFPVDAKAITSFGFRASLNPGLAQDYAATISGNTISLVLPEGTEPTVLASLVPTFAHTGKTVTVGVTAQVSSDSDSNQDFSPPVGVVYTVNADDTSSASYTVTISISGYVSEGVISFDANGGTGTMDDQLLPTGDSANLVPVQFTRLGYTFKEWNTQADGLGDPTGDEAFYTMGPSSLTLYAIWDPKPYSIIFDANGGTGTMIPQAVDYDQTVTLATNEFSLASHRFDGWSLTLGGVVAYAEGAEYTHTLDGDQTLFAVWTELGSLTVTVTVLNPATVDINFSGPAVLSQSNRYDSVLAANLPIKMTVNATAGLGTYHWSLDGLSTHGAMTVDPGAQGPNFVEIDSILLSQEVHTLTLILIDGDGVPHSHYITFGVEE